LETRSVNSSSSIFARTADLLAKRPVGYREVDKFSLEFTKLPQPRFNCLRTVVGIHVCLETRHIDERLFFHCALWILPVEKIVPQLDECGVILRAIWHAVEDS
jgi:hypothetical protein